MRPNDLPHLAAVADQVVAARKRQSDDERNLTDRAPRRAPGEDHAVATVDGATAAMTLTEDNIARVFASRYGGRLLFDHTSGRWLQWAGSHWQPETTRLAYHYARELTRDLNAEGRARWAKAAVFASVETIARTDRAFACTLDQFDRDPWKLGTPAGIVDLKTGSLLPPDPKAMISRITAVAPQPGAPERWLRFLDEATGADAEVIRFLQRLCGYCLTGSVAEHILAFVYGPGGNGKGVFLNVVSRVLKDYAQAADIRTFTVGKHDRHPTELAALHRARFVAASETEQTAEWAEARIKQLTGGDTIRARFMRCDEFEFRPEFKLVIVGNHRPRLRDVGDAIRRRLRIVPFERKPATVNPFLEDELFRAEGGRILQWMVDGCLEWQADGLPVPPAIAAATNDYLDAQDVLGEWITTACDLDRRYFEPSAKLFRSWADYCKANGDDAGTQVRFADALKRRGFDKRATMTGKVWQGLRLRAACGL
jgi:putative DNA primase/helicase